METLSRPEIEQRILELDIEILELTEKDHSVEGAAKWKKAIDERSRLKEQLRIMNQNQQ